MNNKLKYKAAIFTNIAPFYSRSLWYQLNSSDNIDYSFYSSAKGFSGIKTLDINESRLVKTEGVLDWHFLINIFIGHILIFQRGIISKCLSTNYNAYILYGEMHSISNWIAAIICRIRKKPLLFWGHGLYGNERHIKRLARIWYYKIADYNLVYGNRSRTFMINSGFEPDKVFTVYNSLDFYSHSRLYREKNQQELEALKRKLFPENNTFPMVIFIGRLTEEKKISYLIEAISISRKKGNIYNCLIVGGGNMSDELKKFSDSIGVNDLVHFYGPSYDENINSKLIMLSDCCVSPGNVGLTAIHSLSLGTPVITHRNYFNQGPESEAIIEDETGLYFEENNVVDLSDVLDNMILNRKKVKMESSCIALVQQFWNPEKQAEIFDLAIMNSIKNR